MATITVCDNCKKKTDCIVLDFGKVRGRITVRTTKEGGGWKTADICFKCLKKAMEEKVKESARYR